MTEARSVTTCWAYSMQPLLFLYLYEVIAVSPMRALRSQHHLIVGHHLMCVLLLSYGFKATSSTLNARWAQMGYSCFLHMVCEQQTWVALIMYRLKLPGYGIFALVATGMEVLWRLFLWGWCFYVYAELTIFPCTITMWEVIWRVAFPFTALFLILAQCMTIRIHMLMAIKAFRESRRTTAPAARVVSEPTTAAIDRGSAIEMDSAPHTATVDSCTSPTLGTSAAAAHVEVAPARQARGAQSDDACRPHEGKPKKRMIIAPSELVGYVLGSLIVAMIAVLFGLEQISMDSSIVEVRCKNIAVVGGGISGLGATWSLSQSNLGFNVDVFESRARLGGSADSGTFDGHPTDMAFTAMLRFFNLELFFDRLNVEIGQEASGASIVVEDQHGGGRHVFGNTISNNLANKSMVLNFTAEMDRLYSLKLRDQWTLGEEYLMSVTLEEYSPGH